MDEPNMEWLLEDFDLLCDHLHDTDKVRDVIKYRNNLAAFLLHAQHVKAYEFASSYCKGKDVLEVGCFIGYGSLITAGVARKVVAIDLDDTSLDFAKSHRVRENLQFVKATLDGLTFPPESFDVVLAFQVIEHIPTAIVPEFLREIRRVLRPGGVCIMSTPNRKTRLLPFQKPTNPEHFQEFTGRGLSTVLSDVFSDVSIKGVRAIPEIENVEKNRVRQSPLKVYIRRPLHKLLRSIVPKSAKKQKHRRPSRSRDGDTTTPLAEKLGDFGLDAFYLASDRSGIDESLSLFAICRNQ